MADKQINELPSGGALQDADLLVLQRSGTAYNVAGSQIAKQSDMETAEGNISTLQSGKLDKTSMQTITLSAGDTIKAKIDSLPNNTDAIMLQLGTSISDAPTSWAFYNVRKAGNGYSTITCTSFGGGVAYNQWFAEYEGASVGVLTWRQLALKSESTITVQIQLTLPSTVTVPANGTANLLSAVDPSTLTKSATIHGDTIPTGRTLYGAVFLWTNSSVCSMTNCLVEANNKITLTVYNHSANAVSASAVRLLLFYR